MNILYPDSKEQKVIGFSIFLAGPTPRKKEVKSWRPEALNILEKLEFNGTVFVPEREDWTVKFSYDDQVEWELKNLVFCDVIVFWIPREIPDMCGFTTNVEFGMFVDSADVVYGRPNGAVHTGYLDYLYKKFVKENPCEDLVSTLQRAIRITV